MSKPHRNEDGYPFGTGDWARWTNVKRLNWMRNFRDRLTKDDDILGRKLGLSDTDLRQIEADTAELEKIVAREQAQRKIALLGLENEMNAASDRLLDAIDKARQKGIYLPPNTILGKKDN